MSSLTSHQASEDSKEEGVGAGEEVVEEESHVSSIEQANAKSNTAGSSQSPSPACHTRADEKSKVLDATEERKEEILAAVVDESVKTVEESIVTSSIEETNSKKTEAQLPLASRLQEKDGVVEEDDDCYDDDFDFDEDDIVMKPWPVVDDVLEWCCENNKSRIQQQPDGVESDEHQHSSLCSSGCEAHCHVRTSLVGWLVNLYKSWTFSYMNPIFEKGKKQNKNGQHLDLSDLWAVPPELQSDVLVQRFWEAYHKNHNTSGRNSSGSNNNHQTLARTLWTISARDFVPAGFWEMVHISCRIAMPLFLRNLLLMLEQHPNESILQYGGLKWAIGMSLAAALSALAQNRMTYLSTKAGILFRAALTSAIYEHSLRLSPNAGGRAGLSTGEITNMVATDTQKLYDVMIEAHNIWSCPILIVVVSCLLWTILGPELLMGIAILLLFLPVVQVIVARMLYIRNERSKLTDVRIQILTTMLQGIRVTKLNHYESQVEHHVDAIRQQEMKLLRQELCQWGWVMSCAVSSPLIATCAAYSFYALVSEDNILTPSSVFSGLLLFTILRFPINMTARLVGKTAQAVESLRRISRFLERQTRDYGPEHEQEQQHQTQRRRSKLKDNDESLPVVDMKDGAFCITPQDEMLLDVATKTVGNDVTSNTKKRRRRSSRNEEEEEDQESVSSTLVPFTIRNLNFQLNKGEVLAVVGKVGAGKTVLLQALLGEVPPMANKTTAVSAPFHTARTTASSCGSTLSLESQDEAPSSCLSVAGRVAYAPQIPFIINKSLRENVLFGSKYHEQRYEQVLDACCLRHDIQRLGPAGDLTQIGERGVTLSGGQKQRVALARAVYAQANVSLLDDCFSALDSNTARMVFEGLFGKGKHDTSSAEKSSSSGDSSNPDASSDSVVGGFLRCGGTILVTHAIHFLPRADKIMIMSNGTPTFFGTWEELQQEDHKEGSMLKAIVEDGEHAQAEKKSNTQHDHNGKLRRDGIVEEDGFIMTVEEREYGISSLRTWLQWFSNAGGWTFFLSQSVFLILDRGFYVAGDWWLARWADAAYTGMEIGNVYFPPQTDGREAQVRYVTVYVIIVSLSILATTIRSQWAFVGGARCARKMFDAMTYRVLRSPMSYFETTPLGRVLNRFTYDVEVLDVELSVSMTGLMVSFSWLMASIVVMIAVLPWILLGIIPVTAVYCFIQLYYRMSGPDLQRIDAVSRSPLQATLAEGLEGSTSIRAFRKEKRFTMQFRRHVDHNTGAMLNFLAAQRWLGLRIELLGATIGFAVSAIIVCANGTLKIPAGLVGLGIQWAYVFTAALNFFFLRLSESEARITSIERVHETTKLPQEASWETDPSIELDPAWPTKGETQFESVCLRYRKELPLALDSVSFKLQPGMRCGVVGRTGSGKTSLTASLFRLVEIESGRIMLDGVDLAKIGLSDVRGRPNGLRILPQDPVLYSGTLRDCIDPFHCESDEKIVEALQAVNHNGARTRGASILQDRVEEGGSNLSVGERQLLCLARAIVEEPRVLVLDEATASIDTTTDTFIQTMLRTRFRNTTLLTVAHRLHTVMDYDCVLVMDQGKCIEFGPPQQLLENYPNGTFASFVNATGPESAAELREIARASPQKSR